MSNTYVPVTIEPIGPELSFRGQLTQGSRMAELRPDEMVFVDSGRLNRWESDGPHERASLRPVAVE
ncbi:hypothetical protein ACFWPX_20045 [Nocardia sp. NPDC058518]|uniref:hypothetical protein n=1 Tax=Nocardia sp. NPDC058518 TaxID=3346534 RepID=UPI003656EEA8